MNRINLSLGRSGWLATYEGPHAADIRSLMGSDTLPTAYTAQCPASEVLAKIKARNPGVVVELNTAPAGWQVVEV